MSAYENPAINGNTNLTRVQDVVETLTDAEKSALDELARKLRTFESGDVLAELEYHDAGLARWGAWLADDSLDDETRDLAAYQINDHRRRREVCGRELARRDHADKLPRGGARSRITRELIDEIKTRVDLIELMQARGVELKTRGNKSQGRCPFHADKTPSLSVDNARGLWHCFGCHAGGDAIRFVMQCDKVEFVPALRTLAERVGVELPRAEEPRHSAARSNGNGNGNGAANSGARANFEHPYLIQNGRICRRRQTVNGEVIEPLCNFTAEITAEVARDDGADVTRLLTIEGKHADGYGLPVARVDASQFASFKWLAPSFGTRAIVNAGQSAQDHLRAAIQHLSANVQAQHVYTHTGWREIDGQRVFLTATGAPGLDTARVELEKELCRYALPLQPTDSRAAMQASLRFLRIAPLRVTLPLWAAMYLAPLASFLTLDFVLWLYGITGVMKSTAAALALSHYGDFERKDLVSWGNTANHIEKITFLTKDVPVVLDDFAPQSDSVAARNLESVVSRIVRGVGNQSGRGRLRSDLSLRPTYRPRGLVVSTGEQLPDGQSLVARLVTVEFERGDVDVDKLNAAQDEREQYPHAIAGYVQWLAARWDTLQTEIPNAWKTTRTRAHRAGQHLRLPEAIASLFVGLDLALQYAVEIGAITENDAHDLLNTGWDALTETSERQAQLTAEERPTRRFLSVLGELIAQGTARLTDLTAANTPQAQQGTGIDFLGWCDQDYLYLLPSESYRRVSEFVRQQGRHFGVKESALRKALAEENLIETETGSDGKTHLTVRCSASGNGRVLKVRRTEFEKVVGVSP